MSLVKLKAVTLTGLEELLPKLENICADFPDFCIEDADRMLPDGFGGETRSVINPFTPLAGRVSALADEAGISPATAQDNSYANMTDKELEDAVSNAEEMFSTAKTRLDGITESIDADKKITEQLSHLLNTNIDLSKLFDFRFFTFRFGHMPRESYENLAAYEGYSDDYFFFASSVEKRDVWGMYFTPQTKEKRIDALFNSLHFERIRISSRVSGTASEAYETLRGELDRYDNELHEAENSLKETKQALTPILGALRLELDRRDRDIAFRRRLVYSDGSFTMTGWIPKSQQTAFAAAVKGTGVEAEFADSAGRDDIKPPTKLKNNLLFSPFEDFVRLYGLPSGNEMDPTPLVGITYMLFFGMMFGDVGQGALICILGALVWRLKKNFLGRIMERIGVFAMIFGVIYGSVFGSEEIIHGFNPSQNINTILIGAVVFGAGLICVVMVMNIINGIRQHDVEKTLFSSNGVAGLVLYISLLLVAASMFGLLPFSVPTAPLIILAVVSVLLIFLRAPLATLIDGHDRLGGEKLGGHLLESGFELFDVFLSILSNTLSYIRVGVFALSHVGMMTVVYQLAAQADGSYNIIVLIIGNIFVTGFEGMIVCIQALRLEFYEIFGRFYEGNGREYIPSETSRK